MDQVNTKQSSNYKYKIKSINEEKPTEIVHRK